MRAFKYIVWIILIVVGLFYVLPATLLQVPYFQKKISHVIAKYIQERIDTEVRIQQIEFQPFNKLILKNVYMEDQQGEILFKAKRVACGFEFLPLFQKKFYFNSAQLYTFELYLTKESQDSPLNIEYIINAFQKEEEDNTESPIDLSIKSLYLGHGTLSYKIKDQVINDKYEFNTNDLFFTDIAAKIELNKFDSKNLNLNIKRFTFKEKSGLFIKQIHGDILINEEGTNSSEMYLELSNSQILLTDIYTNIDRSGQKVNMSEEINISFQLRPSQVLLQDIGPILPILNNYDNVIEIKGLTAGSLDNLTFTDFIIKDSKNLLIWINANIRNLTKSELSQIYLNANIADSYIHSEALYTIIDNFQKQSTSPDYLNNLGHISFDGHISGNLNNLNSDLYLLSEIGDLKANINFGKNKNSFLKGNISSSSINLRDLLNNNNFGNVTFDVNMDVLLDAHKELNGNIQALVNEIDYKSYKYENINFSGKLSNKSFEGVLNTENQDGSFNAQGLFIFDGKDSEFNFTAKVSELKLDKLNLIKRYTDPELSFTLTANIKGIDPENILGEVSVKNLFFSTDNGDYTINDIHLLANHNENQKEWTIESDILNGKISGDYSLSSLINSMKHSLFVYLPSFIEEPLQVNSKNSNFSVDLSIADTREFSYIFELPVTIYDKAHIQGSYNNQPEKISFHAEFPYLKYKNYRIEDSKINLSGNHELLNLKISAVNLQTNQNKLLVSTELDIANDTIFTSINWKDNKNEKYKGSLNFHTYLELPKKETPFFTSIHFQPSELVFNDSLWRISPTTIKLKDERIHIDHFEAFHNDQSLKLNGYISKDPEDELFLDLEKVDLDYIFLTLNKKALAFGGVASGYVNAKDLFTSRQLSTQLNVERFSFNHVTLGNLILDGKWIEEEEGIQMKGLVLNNDTSKVDVDGFIYPVKEEISIWFDAENVSASFLRKYLGNIVQDLSGELSGKLHLLGNLNDPTVEGNVYVKDGTFGVEFLNTKYTFSDWIRCTPTEIRVNNTIFQDKYGNKALVSGYVTHNAFTDFHFDANLSYENFLVFDANNTTNPTFYGSVFGTGTASIKGTEYLVNIDVSMQNTDNTHLTLNFMDEADIVDYNFIKFVQKEEKDTISTIINPWHWESKTASTSVEDNGTDIRLNLHMIANNQAFVEVIMDPVSGDKITGRGNGSMQIQYGTKIPMKVIGSYSIESGKYNFSFQQALFRNFEIEEGSSITFTGDPYSANLDIKAAYTVTANLGDLDQQLLQVSARNNVPVNCVLLLSGPLQHPLINFDITLPNSSAEVERQVKSYIRTEDMLNRQIVYLLVLGRFYTSPEYARGDVRFNNDLSYLTSTLSNQLSNMLGGISDSFQVGTKIHQSYEGEETSTEVEILLSSTLLNNRLIINGNFGYIDNPYTHQNNSNVPLVGDFDVEYKLTKNGDIRLKGFNRYNYRNYFSTTPEMTQGIGIMFRRDFNNLNDLFGRRKKLELINLPEESEKNNSSVASPETEELN